MEKLNFGYFFNNQFKSDITFTCVYILTNKEIILGDVNFYDRNLIIFQDRIYYGYK